MQYVCNTYLENMVYFNSEHFKIWREMAGIDEKNDRKWYIFEVLEVKMDVNGVKE